MSGGSHNYAYQHVRTMAHSITDRMRDEPPEEFESLTMRDLRERFAAHLLVVADAMRAIEWVDSCDWSPGDERDALLVVLDHGKG